MRPDLSQDNIKPILNEVEKRRAHQHVDRLFETHRAALQRYLYGFVNNTADVEELMQETYIKAARMFDPQQGESQSKNFLFVIATNAARDYQRSLARKAKLLAKHDQEAPLLQACEEPGPEHHAELSQTKDYLLQALKQLSPKYREVFVMHRLMHMSVPDIARRLSVSTRTVERRMQRAMKFCRKQLEGHF